MFFCLAAQSNPVVIDLRDFYGSTLESNHSIFNAGIADNQLGMEPNEEEVRNEHYEVEVEQRLDYARAHQNQTHFNYHQIIPRMLYIHNKK